MLDVRGVDSPDDDPDASMGIGYGILVMVVAFVLVWAAVREGGRRRCRSQGHDHDRQKDKKKKSRYKGDCSYGKRHALETRTETCHCRACKRKQCPSTNKNKGGTLSSSSWPPTAPAAGLAGFSPQIDYYALNLAPAPGVSLLSSVTNQYQWIGQGVRPFAHGLQITEPGTYFVQTFLTCFVCDPEPVNATLWISQNDNRPLSETCPYQNVVSTALVFPMGNVPLSVNWCGLMPWVSAGTGLTLYGRLNGQEVARVVYVIAWEMSAFRLPYSDSGSEKVSPYVCSSCPLTSACDGS